MRKMCLTNRRKAFIERNMKRHINFLEKELGNHTMVAKELGITNRHYRDLRSSEKFPLWIKVSIKNLVKILKIERRINS